MKLYKTKKNCGKLLLGILAFCTGMILLTGCGSSSEQKQNKNEETAEENKEEDKVQIGLTVDSFVIERWIRDRDVFVATARELGAEVNVQDAGADVKEQISQIEYFINKQVDVIVVIARDCGALSDAIQKAQSAGIPVISYDRMVNNANTDLYISFDNRKVGEIMAQALVNALPQGGDVFMIQGSSSDNNVQMVKQGFDDMLADTDLHVVMKLTVMAGQQNWLPDMWRKPWKNILMLRELCAEMMTLPVRSYRYWQRISLPEMWLL